MPLQVKSSIAGATSGRSQVFWCKTEDIYLNEEFQLFPIPEERVKAIYDSIMENGFNQEEPIALWNDEEGHKNCLDGNTRTKAALMAGIKEVPVVYKQFKDKKEALNYAFDRQANRRNMSQADLLMIAQKIGRTEAFAKYGTKKDMIAQIASTANVSKMKAERTVAVLDKASPEQLEDIQQGKETINSVYNKVINKRKKEKEEDEAEEMQKAEDRFFSGSVFETNIPEPSGFNPNHVEPDHNRAIIPEYETEESEDPFAMEMDETSSVIETEEEGTLVAIETIIQDFESMGWDEQAQWLRENYIH